MPADTPAVERNLPSSTHRWWRYLAPSSSRMSTYAQCVVAGRSSSKPTDARMTAPVHTDITTSAVSAALMT